MDKRNKRQSQLQNRFQPLPSIQQTHNQQGFETALVPVGPTHKSQMSHHITNGGPMLFNDVGDPKIRQFDNRLSVAEQSNRALLEEVVRLQGELKQAHRKTEDMLSIERQARQQLTENLRASNDLIGQLGARLKRAEEKVADERSAVGALVNHTKQVEQAVLGSQQELIAKRDHQMTKFLELQNDVDEANRMREQLERAMATMVDEIRQLKSRVDSQSIEFGSIMHEVKDRAKRLDDENRQAMDNQRKYHESHHSVEQATSVLRSQLDARLGEVRDVLMDLRGRISTEETERRQQEQQVFLKMNDLQSQVHEQNRKREEGMHVLDVVQREREHASDNERLKMQSKIAEIAEEVSKKILGKEIRLREEAQQKFGNIEKYLNAEQSARIAHEQAMREENEKRWTALQKLTEGEVLNVRENQKNPNNHTENIMDRLENLEGKLLSRRQSNSDLAEEQKYATKYLKTRVAEMTDKVESLERTVKNHDKYQVELEEEKHVTKNLKTRVNEISNRFDSLERSVKSRERQITAEDEKARRSVQRRESISRRTEELDRHKNAGGLSKVGETMEKLEKMQVETKKQLEQVMKAEITSRQSQDKQIENKIEDVQEKLGVAISTLQQAIGGINEQVITATSEYQDKLKVMIEEYQGSETRGSADMDARVTAIQAKLTQLDESIDSKISQVLGKVMDADSKEETKKALRTQHDLIEEIEDWRSGAERKLKQIKEKMDDLSPEIEQMNKANESVQDDMKELVESEQKERIRDVQMVRADLEMKYKQIQTDIATAKASVVASGGGATTPMPISQKEKMTAGKGGGKVDQGTLDKMGYLETEVNKYRGKFLEMKEEIAKVDGTVNTVKVHLGRKIEQEGKQRKEETQDLQYILEDVKKKVEKMEKEGAKSKKKDDGDSDKKKDDGKKDKDKSKSDDGEDKKKKKKSGKDDSEKKEGDDDGGEKKKKKKSKDKEKEGEGEKDEDKKDGEDSGEKKKKKKDKDGEGKKEKKKSKEDKDNDEGKEKKEKKEKKDREKDGGEKKKKDKKKDKEDGEGGGGEDGVSEVNADQS
ncbi:uncharacterized protein [Antedon mediterranea]|uniref:uncharacterized protein isoform X3 n=1 Tax=Antedon mediterranea TaxID=105859 RepID=UPI003AF610ED